MWYQCNTVVKISIHALLAESDVKDTTARQQIADISIHALLAESDSKEVTMADFDKIFLSTLSLRRATPHHAKGLGRVFDFYPRSPCGERQFQTSKLCDLLLTFLSTLSLRRATVVKLQCIPGRWYFYPRSPCGERRKQSNHHKSGR